MKTFKEFMEQQHLSKRPYVQVVILPAPLLEYEKYKDIPGTANSYRPDPANTSTKTQKHVHVYAKPKGKGEEIYSVNLDGSGHDGYSGTQIPKSHADYFRKKNFKIKKDNILEWITPKTVSSFSFYIILEECA